MASHSDIALRWANEVGKPHPRYIGTGHEPRVRVIGDRLYSYGTHFELARLVGNRSSGFFLLNGDRYSVSTSGHQSIIRGAVAQTGIESMIVPYSALEAAGIVLDSIRPLEIQPERTEKWTEDVEAAWAPGDPGTASTWDVSHDSEYPFPPYGNGLPGYVSRRWTRPGSKVYAVETLRGHDYAKGKFANYSPGERVSYYTEGGSGVEIEGGRFKVTRYRHWLGASLFSARVQGRKGRVKFLSAFDENERRPLYFLCELPRCTARTVAEALDALAPRIVHAAYAQGRTVERQGDIFAIPTELNRKTLKERGASFEKRAHLLDTNHTATEVALIKGAVYARGCLYHDPGAWRDPDHARRKMGDGKAWHLIVRNTVPRVRQGGRVTAGRAL